jgi:hypothetical protein
VQKCFFFHIPKCAGTSVWHALRDVYGRRNVFQIGVLAQREKFEAMSSRKRQSYGAIGGHVSLVRFLETTGDLRNYYKIATFRHPVERLISHYHFVCNLPTHPHYDVVSRISFGEFARIPGMINMQTTLMCDEADPNLALSTLDRHFDDWCLMEDLDILIGQLYHRAGRNIESVPHANKRKKSLRQGENDAILKEVEQINEADMAFYGMLSERQANAPLSRLGDASWRNADRIARPSRGLALKRFFWGS